MSSSTERTSQEGTKLNMDGDGSESSRVGGRNRWLMYTVITPRRFPKNLSSGQENDQVLSLFDRAVKILRALKESSSSMNFESNEYQSETDIHLEEYLKDLLSSLEVERVQYVYNAARTTVHVEFFVQEEAEEVVSRLLVFAGFGSQYNSRFAINPAQSAIGFAPITMTGAKLGKLFPKDDAFNEMNQALNRIAARVKINDLVESTRKGAELTFDYMVFLVVASILAGVGLATDNAVVVVASMLVSPLMGPIVSVVFGWSISQNSMISKGLINELISLLVCVVVGVLVGVCFTPWGNDFGWPTKEMFSRGQPGGLLIGLAIAIPSGVGVALSVLQQNAGSLVGVAISASLLPPAVNTGMCWAYAVLGPIGDSFYGAGLKQDLGGHDYWALGAISMCLTLLNIVCVWAAAVISFKLKEVPQLHNMEDASTFQNILKVRAQNVEMTSKESQYLANLKANRNKRFVQATKGSDAVESNQKTYNADDSLHRMDTLTDLYHNTLTLPQYNTRASSEYKRVDEVFANMDEDIETGNGVGLGAKSTLIKRKSQTSTTHPTMTNTNNSSTTTTTTTTTATTTASSNTQSSPAINKTPKSQSGTTTPTQIALEELTPVRAQDSIDSLPGSRNVIIGDNEQTPTRAQSVLDSKLFVKPGETPDNQPVKPAQSSPKPTEQISEEAVVSTTIAPVKWGGDDDDDLTSSDSDGDDF